MKRVLGHGAKCCGECETCAPKEQKQSKAKKADVKADFHAETVLFVEEDEQ